MRRNINLTHVILALLAGALLMHVYRTRTVRGKASGS